VANDESSFSKFRLIVTYLRSAMTEIQLMHLVIVSIEHEFTQEMDLK